MITQENEVCPPSRYNNWAAVWCTFSLVKMTICYYTSTCNGHTKHNVFMALPVKYYILPGVCVLHECVRTQQQHYPVLATAVCTYCVKSRKTTTICTRLFSSTSTVVLTLSCLIHCLPGQSQKCFAKYFHLLPLPFSLLDSSIPTQLLFFTVCLFWKKILVCRFGPQ
jgi:hypothetical protein